MEEVGDAGVDSEVGGTVASVEAPAIATGRD